VAFLRGNLDQADGLYRQAMAGTAEAVRRSPDDPKRVFDHAQNVFWLGEVARARGRTDQAVAAYGEYKHLADRLVALEPDNLKWRMEGLYGVENIGISLYNKRRFGGAASQFQSALGPMQNLASIDPGNQTYQKELSTVLAWLADAQRAQGNLDMAIALRQRQVALLNQAVASGVTDVDFRQQLIPAHQGLGILLTWRGQTDRGIEELRSAVSEAERLIPIEPANTFWQSLAAGARLDLARSLLLFGHRDEAAQETANACSIVAAIRPADLVTARQTACVTMRARLALQSGANGEAVALAERALVSARKVHSDDPLKDRYTAAAIYLLMGDARRNAGDAEGARAAWSNALAALPEGVPETAFEMDEHAAILERLERRAEAQPLRAKLASIGYQSAA
jgi:tetratricopeptide (TPR) repeat protein